MQPLSQKEPLGVVHDTNSHGRFDLIIYEDGILAVKGTYVGVMLLGAGAGMAGAGGSGLGGAIAAGTGAAAGSTASNSYERKRLAKLLSQPRADIIASNAANFFIARTDITGVVLHKRWHGCSATIRMQADPDGRKFSWKPALNKFSSVRDILETAFGDKVMCD